MHRIIDRAVLVGVAVSAEEVDTQCPWRLQEVTHSLELKHDIRIPWASAGALRTRLSTTSTIHSTSSPGDPMAEEGNLKDLKEATSSMANRDLIVNNPGAVRRGEDLVAQRYPSSSSVLPSSC